MRIHIAAACAAVLVGVSPAGPFASAQLLGAVARACTSAECAATARSLSLGVAFEPSPSASILSRRGESRPGRTDVRPVRAPWRSASGPAPSRAPPLA